MKNKEIEVLLNELKDKYSYEPYDTTGKVYTTISYEEGQLLSSHIEQLENNRDKAIEYLNTYAGYDNNFCLDYHEINPLIDILKGGSDE